MTYSNLLRLIRLAEGSSRKEFISKALDGAVASPKMLNAIYDLAQNNCCVRGIVALSGKTQSSFAATYNIPLRTVETWCTHKRTPPPYVSLLLLADVLSDLE